MDALVGALMTAGPFAAVGLMLALTNRRARRRQEAVGRQIALTDAIHARLGGIVAPVVDRLRGGRWQVTIAVPLERPSVVASVLAIVEEVFAQPGTAPYEVVLRRQHAPGPPTRARRPAPVREESLSWT